MVTKITYAFNHPERDNSTSPQSGRQNLAQGEASPDDIGTSETLGCRRHLNTARFSGRKNLSPAKAGSKSQWGQVNSVAGYAGSLTGLTHRRIQVMVIVVLIVCFTGCTGRPNGGISSGTGALPQSSATPAQVSSTAEVVKVTTQSVHTSPGSSLEAVVKLAITSGYHVNANPATYSYLIATEVKAANTDGIIAGIPTYPAATKQKFEFAEEPLAVYEGDIEVKLPLKTSATMTAGERSLPITVRVQACDTEKCFPPATLNATIPVELK